MTPVAEQIRIRPMCAVDLESVQAIARTLPEAPQWPDASYRKAIAHDGLPSRVALVAEDTTTGAIVGFVVAQVIPPDAELETIAVAKNAQAQGVGRKMFVELADRLRAQNIASLHLEVRISNAKTLGFYQRLGFRQIGRRPRYYAHPIEDAVLMTLPNL